VALDLWGQTAAPNYYHHRAATFDATNGRLTQRFRVSFPGARQRFLDIGNGFYMSIEGRTLRLLSPLLDVLAERALEQEPLDAQWSVCGRTLLLSFPGFDGWKMAVYETSTLAERDFWFEEDREVTYTVSANLVMARRPARFMPKKFEFWMRPMGQAWSPLGEAFRQECNQSPRLLNDQTLFLFDCAGEPQVLSLDGGILVKGTLAPNERARPQIYASRDGNRIAVFVERYRNFYIPLLMDGPDTYVAGRRLAIFDIPARGELVSLDLKHAGPSIFWFIALSPVGTLLAVHNSMEEVVTFRLPDRAPSASSLKEKTP
jgi:hypothetical protein